MKILHLPQEIAGQLGIFQRELGFEVLSMASPHPFGYPYPIDIVLHKKGGRWLKVVDRIGVFFQKAEEFDVFHYYFASYLLPRMIDVRYEKWRGKRIVTFHLFADMSQA